MLGYVFQILLDNIDLLTIVAFGICIFFKRDFILNIRQTENEDNTTCNDKDCVRCNKYTLALTLALQRLSELPKDDVVVDIKSSLLHTQSRIKCLDQKPNVFFYKSLSSVPVWDKTIFEDCDILESCYWTIFEEFKNLRRKTDCRCNTNKTPQGSWDVFPLINQGELIQENAKHCPKTMDIVNKLPCGMRNNVFSNAMFSVAKPQTVIAEHYGPTNVRLRCHLGLQTTPDSTLFVADETVKWEEGACIVFDDSFLHSVEHTGISDAPDEVGLLTSGPTRSAERVVLIVDLWHPDLASRERNVIDRVFSPL